MGLKINYKTVKNSDEAFSKVKTIITPEYIEKFQVKAEISYDEVKKKVIAKGSGFTLTLQFLDQFCDLDLDLSLLLRPLKSKITSIIEAQIEKNL